MKFFQLDKEYYIVCESKETRNGFKHTANLLHNGYSVKKEVKVNYLNRTWEAFTFETVLKKAINKWFENKEAKEYIDKIETENN